MSWFGRAVVVAALAAAAAAIWLVRSSYGGETPPVEVPSGPVVRGEERPQVETERIAASRFVEIADEGVEPPPTDAPILVSGRVVDEGDVPIAGAEIIVYYPRPPNSGSAEYPGVTSRNTRPRTDEAGRFEIRAKHVTPEIVVEAKHPELGREPEKCVAAGTRDVTLMLRGRLRTGKVTATLAKKWLPVAQTLEFLAGTVEPGSDFRSRASAGFFNKDGSSHLSVAPGTIEVWVVSVLDHKEPLVRIEDVIVPREGVCDDPRLRDIDFPSSVGVLDLSLVDAAGDPVPLSMIRTKATTFVFVKDGRDALVLGKSPTLIEITATNFRTEAFDAVPGERTVKLQPAATVAFKLQATPSLPKGVTLGLIVRLVRSDIRLLEDTRARQAHVLLPFGKTGEQRNRMNIPGDYEGSWILGPGPLDVYNGTLVNGAKPVPIRVADTDHVQEITLECPIDLIEREAADFPSREKK